MKRIVFSLLILSILIVAGYAKANELSPALRAQIESDLSVLPSIQGSKSTQLNRSIFGGTDRLDGRVYLAFFKRHIQFMTGGFCMGDDVVACVQYGFPTMFINENYLKFPLIKRLSILLHESGHTIARRETHDLCPAGVKGFSGQEVGGMAACDRGFEGSYGLQIVFARNVAENCDSCSLEIRDQAKALVTELMPRILNPAALQKIMSDK